MNDTDIGDTYEGLVALTFFEEEILAPVQHTVRVYSSSSYTHLNLPSKMTGGNQ